MIERIVIGFIKNVSWCLIRWFQEIIFDVDLKQNDIALLGFVANNCCTCIVSLSFNCHDPPEADDLKKLMKTTVLKITSCHKPK
jgi:hypothetical protein